MKNWINLTDKLLQKELVEVRKRYERSPDKWLRCEPVARVLYWQNDPSASEYFKKAIKFRAMVESKRGADYLALGNYCRMANEPELGGAYLRQGYEIMQQEKISVVDPNDVVFVIVYYLVMLCFLLGNYEEALIYGTMLREKDPDFDPMYMPEQFTLLAEAKLNRDLAKAEKTVENTSWYLYSSRLKVSSDGPVTPWDAYDLALQTVDELKN
jgi:tetratricopeptide (TPR) repeat protein